MNNGRIWCVVNPTVGLPLFLGSVATISLIVHSAVLSHTTWVSDFFSGSHKKVASSASVVDPAALTGGDSNFAIKVTPVAVPGNSPATAFVVTVVPKSQSEPVKLTEGATEPPTTTVADSTPK